MRSVHGSTARCYELVLLRADHGARLDFTWPREPGAVYRGADGRAELLHFAPARWLVPEPSAALLDSLRALTESATAALFDVGGKWLRLQLPAAQARQSLRRAVDIDSILDGRECCAATLFDCPVILLRGELQMDVWVQASFCDSFAAQALTSPE